MKKQILLLLSLFTTSFIFAQPKTTFGIKAGITSASVKGEASNTLNNMVEYANGRITTNRLTGLFAGGTASIPISEIFSIEPGLFYSQKGYEMRGEMSYKNSEFLKANGKAQLKSHYIDLPVMLKADINGLQIFAGPQVSYLTKADLNMKAGALGFNFYNDQKDVTEEFNKIDVGMTGGIGYQIANGLNISATYDHGLARIDEDRQFDAFNRSFKIGLGFRF